MNSGRRSHLLPGVAQDPGPHRGIKTQRVRFPALAWPGDCLRRPCLTIDLPGKHHVGYHVGRCGRYIKQNSGGVLSGPKGLDIGPPINPMGWVTWLRGGFWRIAYSPNIATLRYGWLGGPLCLPGRWVVRHNYIT